MDLQLAFLDPFTWAAIIGGGVSIFTSWMGSRAMGRAEEQALGIESDSLDKMLALERERMAHEREMAGGGMALGRERLALDAELGRGHLNLARDQFGLSRQQFGYGMAEKEAEHRRLRPYREFGYRGLVDLNALTTPGREHAGTGGPLEVPNPRGSDYSLVDFAATPLHSEDKEDPFAPPVSASHGS